MPVTRPPKIQLAVQGGGARVLALLAALDAIQSLVRQDKLQVTRIAGTSAGAIAASLFAAGINLSDLRNEIKTLAGEVIGEFRPPGVLKFVRLLLQGKPLWSSRSFEKVLETILSRERVKKIADTKNQTGTELLIVSADLDQSRRIIHTPDEFVVAAVADSCGIPFCFRTWREPRANRVDGGICENLPVESLVNDEATHGAVIGISFDRVRPKAPRNMYGFAMALLDAAIDNSVDRAVQRLGSERVLSIDCPYGTFDFDVALERGLGELYDLTRIRSKEFFETYLDPEEMTVGDPWEVGDLNNMLKIGEMYDKQHRDIPCKNLYRVLDVTVNSLEDDLTPDRVDYSTTIEAMSDPVYCHAIALSSAVHNPVIRKTQLIVFDEGLQQKIEVVRVYMKRPTDPDLRYVLLCFVPPLLPGGGPYNIKSADYVINGMNRLREPPHQDELRVTPTRARGELGRVELVVRLPERFVTATLKNKNGENWGQAMSDWELRERLTPGFRTLGWCGTNLASTTSWAVDVQAFRNIDD